MAKLIPYHLTDTYSYEAVQAIDRTGILLADGTCIDFQECARNFARAYPEAKGRCVAERDYQAEVPYFEFYACGKSVVIRFDRTGFRAEAKNRRDFLDLQYALEDNGYTSYDLS